MKRSPLITHRLPVASLFAAAFLLLCGGGSANAQQVTLNFDGLQNQELVGSYYNGGLSSHASGPGPAYGVTFVSPASARVSTTTGGGQTVLFVGNLYDAEMDPFFMNVAGGFTGPFSFQYATPDSSLVGSVTIYDGFDGSGNVLATQALPGRDL
jgi:hypothetical protein